MTQPLEIYTLGGLTIQRDHTAVTGFVSRKVEALLVYLACEPREHPREFLAEFFWDNVPQARSLANLRMALSSLQQQLESYVVVSRQTIAINPQSPIWLDIRELQTVLVKADQLWARTGSLPGTAVRELDAALKLYRGDFLTGFHLRESQGFDDWRLLEQERLRSKVIAILHRLTRQMLERGAYREGIEYASHLLQLDPLREEAYRQMMQLQVGLGERSAAAAQYKTLERLLQQELGVEPDAETTHLYEQIVQGTIELNPARPPKHNLPYPSTPFVERHNEQAYVAERLDGGDCRLLTLVGQGGTGKTRLALHTALERVNDYQDGVYLATFNAVDSPGYLLPPIAAALKLSTGDDVLTDLIDFLRDRHILLVLDNFEYVLDGAPVLDELLNQTRWLKLLVISRERLQLHQEWILPIGGLECPPDRAVADLEQYAAAKLFAYGARRVQPHFSLDQDQAGVKRICDLVEGMPLGLELASAWTSMMSVGQIAAQIEQSLGFLETSSRNVPQRHRSIRALFEHSWTILGDPERNTLMRLSVFQSEFGSEPAGQIAQSTIVILRALIEKSLLRVGEKDIYNLHPLLRRYANEKLQQTSEADTTFEAHALYFMEQVERDEKSDQDDHIHAYYDDVRAAMAWLTEHGRAEMLLRLTGALIGFWQYSGYLSEGREWLARALELPSDGVSAEIRARALHAAGVLAWRQADFDPAREFLKQAAALAREAGNLTHATGSLMYLGYISMNLGDHESALDYFAENLELGRTLENKTVIARSLGNMGLISTELMDYETAKQYLEEAIAYAEELQARELMQVALSNLGVAEFRLQNYAAAEQNYTKALELARAMNSRINIIIALVNLGELNHTQGQLSLAAQHYAEGLDGLRGIGDKLSLVQTIEMIAFLSVDRENFEIALNLFGAAEAQRDALGTPIIPRERERYDDYLGRLHTQVSDAAFKQGWAEGRLLSLDQAIDLALANLR